MFTGELEKVQICVDADQFTQIVDWFGDNFSVVGHDADENTYYDIEIRVNTSSFKFFLLQYSGCVQALDTEKQGETLRSQMRDTLRVALGKYESDL